MKLNSLIKRADDLFRQFMLKLWGAPDRIQCVQCEHFFLPDQIEVGHIVGRRHYATRWKTKNALPLCRLCNQNAGTTEDLVKHISIDDCRELHHISHDPSFRLTEEFILTAISAYE